jgi:hypothetical protein
VPASEKAGRIGEISNPEIPRHEDHASLQLLSRFTSCSAGDPPRIRPARSDQRFVIVEKTFKLLFDGEIEYIDYEVDEL